MSFALPESLREYIDNRVAAGNCGNTSAYIGDLVRRDQEEQAKKRLRDLIEEWLASGQCSAPLQVLGGEHGLGPLEPMQVAVYRSRASSASKVVDSLQRRLLQSLRHAGA